MQKYTGWHKASYSSGSGENCVEQGVEATTGRVGVRDTKDHSAGILEFSPEQWAAFTATLKQGDSLV